MKIIELLTKIANGEEVPKNIKFYDKYYIWYDNGYTGNKGYCLEPLKSDSNSFLEINTVYDLNREVEIIEEETKPITKESIEALGYACGEIQKCFTNGWKKSLKNKPLNEEDKKIEKLDTLNLSLIDANKVEQVYDVTKKEIILDIQTIQHWVNKTIDAINEMREDK